ncbi:MAG: hypothetical protein KDD55_13230 [Bdellovibrionales bacterium]|nr:hypothetical protein [Bdellovibrionales bacterium]
MGHQDRKPTLVLYGNCQLSCAKFILESLPTITDQFDIGFGTSIDTPNGRVNYNDVEEDILKRCHFLIEQIAEEEMASRFVPFAQSEILSKEVKRFKIPSLSGAVYWPTHFHDYRNKDYRELEQYSGKGPYPVGDRVINNMIREGVDPQRVAQEYIDSDFGALMNLARLFEMWNYCGTQRDLDSDIQIHSYVLENLQHKQLFYTVRHPTMEMMGVYVALILDALGLMYPSYWEDVQQLAYDPIEEYHFPVHPSIGASYGMKWVTPEKTYRHYDNGSFPFSEFIHRYAHFTH